MNYNDVYLRAPGFNGVSGKSFTLSFRSHVCKLFNQRKKKLLFFPVQRQMRVGHDLGCKGCVKPPGQSLAL